MSEERTYEYELLSHTDDTVVGSFWFDGKKVCYSNRAIESIISNLIVDGLTARDGERFMQHVHGGFRGGYMALRSVRRGDE